MVERMLKKAAVGLFHGAEAAASGAGAAFGSVMEWLDDGKWRMRNILACIGILGLACGLGLGSPSSSLMFRVIATGGIIVFGLLLLVAGVLFLPAAFLFLLSAAFWILWALLLPVKRLFGPNPDMDKPSAQGP